MKNPPLDAKQSPLHVLFLRNTSIYQQLQLEEALLRADSRNWCVINQGTSPAIVMGISGKPESLINPEKYNANPIPLIRRFSGGGTVVVDHNTCFISWICNAEDTNVSPCPEKIHEWIEGHYQNAYPHLSMKRIENDYVIGQRKFAGNAQYLTKNRWLHHSTFLWDYEHSLMEYLLLPQRIPQYREKRSHEDFLCTLKEYFSSNAQFFEAFLQTLTSKYLVVEVSLDQIKSLQTHPHRKSVSLSKYIS